MLKRTHHAHCKKLHSRPIFLAHNPNSTNYTFTFTLTRWGNNSMEDNSTSGDIKIFKMIDKRNKIPKPYFTEILNIIDQLGNLMKRKINRDFQ